LLDSLPTLRSEGTNTEAEDYLEKLRFLIKGIRLKPDNWIVSDIEQKDVGAVDNNKITKIEFKPLDVSPYCKELFEKCSKTLIMSATILDTDSFCRNVGLKRDYVKFIQVDSDFPLELIYHIIMFELLQPWITESLPFIMK
jgi:Rad3-related DNA helicase